MIDKNIGYQDSDIKYLSIYLGINDKLVKKYNVIVTLIFLFLLELIIFLFDLGHNLYLYFIPIILSLCLFVILSFKNKYPKRREKYKQKVLKKYDEYKNTYSGYKTYLVGVKPNGVNKLSKNSCILFTNGYRLIIKEDIFKYSGYKLDDNSYLKVFDDINLMHNTCYNFLINEIKSFKLNGKYRENHNLETYTYDAYSYDTISIVLKDLTEIEISSNVYNLLKEVNGLAEIK